MKKLFASLMLAFALVPFGYAQDSIGDKVQDVKEGAVETKNAVADDARAAGQEIKKTANKARRAVITRCADGRNTIKGETGCKGHGGVSPTN